MPKVAHLTSVHSPLDTRILYKECASLREKGFDVVLIAPHDRDETRMGVRIRAVPHVRSRLLRMTITVWRVYRSALSERADLYHLHDPELLTIGQLLRISGRRVVYDMHENVPKALLGRRWIWRRLRPLVSRTYQSIEKLLLTGLPVVFAERSYRTDYERIDRYAVVQNMPLAEFLLAVNEPRRTEPTLGYIGALAAERGVTALLRLVRDLGRSGRHVGLDLIGPFHDSRYAEEVRAFIKREDLRDVRLHGRLPANEALRILSRCHIGMAVLHPLPNFLHSYPTKMFEYMGLGIPVVASDFPLYRSVVEPAACGLCVDATSKEALFGAVSWLLDHPEDAVEMGRRGRDAVAQQFSWSTEFAELVKLYDSLFDDLTNDPAEGRDNRDSVVIGSRAL